MMLGGSLPHPTAIPGDPKPRCALLGLPRNSAIRSRDPTLNTGLSRAWPLIFGFLLKSDKLREFVFQADLQFLLPYS